MTIRQARPEEAHLLTGLAMRSKAFWGYDDEFMEACRSVLTVTEDKIRRHQVWLAMEGPEIAGFYTLIAGEIGILDDMFVKPAFIGTGTGKRLWDHMTALARRLGVREIGIDADPNAEGFYIRMGAVRVGDVESTAVPGRFLPKMKVTLR